MKCERIQELCADYLRGELAGNQKEDLERHLRECVACREETEGAQALWARLASLPAPQPSAAMDARFAALLAAERRRLESDGEAEPFAPRLVQFLTGLWPWRQGLQFGLAAALFGLGLLLGLSLAGSHRAGPQGIVQDPTLTQLREEVSGLRQMVTLALLQEASASERLRGAEWSSQLPAADDRVLAALLRALDSDPNVNVRLAAVGALEHFGDHASVRQGLLAALPRQHSPLVQVEVIRLLVELKERQTVPALKGLLQDTAVNPTVRECAEWGLEQLG